MSELMLSPLLWLAFVVFLVTVYGVVYRIGSWVMKRWGK